MYACMCYVYSDIIAFLYIILNSEDCLGAGAPNFGKTWGDNLFQPGTPEISYRAANVSKFGGLFFASNYIETRVLV